MAFTETTTAAAELVFAAGPQNAQVSGETFGNPPVQIWAYDNYNGVPNGLANNTYIYKHELLHGLGLNHSAAVFGQTSNLAIPADQDDGTTLYGNWNVGWVNDYQLFDIAALQYLYGPPPNQRAGNDTYVVNPPAFSPGSPQVSWPLLWDGGGYDTLDYSSFTVPVDISLEPGTLSRINGATGNILSGGGFTINYRTVIEAVSGGAGSDRLTGNSADNTFRGNGGNDTIDGGAGSDTAIFRGPQSAYTVVEVSGGLRVTGPDGVDTLISIEKLVFDESATSRAASLAGIQGRFEQNNTAALGLAIAYDVLLGGVPTIDGFEFLIDRARTTNFGTDRPDVVFNFENSFINLTNNLVQGNPAALANFNALTNNAPTLAGDIAAIYNAIVPTSVQTDAGRAFISRPEGIAFYKAVAAERGVAGDDGAAVVALSSLLGIVVRDNHKTPGVGADAVAFYNSVMAGSATVPKDGAVFTPIENADGAPGLSPGMPAVFGGFDLM